MTPLQTHSGSRWTSWLAALVIAYLCVVTYRCVVTDRSGHGVLRPGLDESWMWALSAAHDQHLVYGRDLVFTYGPLGFLQTPRAVGNSLQWAWTFAAFVQLVLAAALAALARSVRRSAFFAGVAVLAVAFAYGLWTEYAYRAVLGLALLAGLLDSPLALVVCALAGLFAAVCFFIKFNLSLTVVAMLAVWSLTLLGLRRDGRLARLVIAGGSFLLIASVLGASLFPRFADFVAWLSLSWQVASGYGAAMSVSGPLGEAAAAVALLLAFWAAAWFARGAARAALALFAMPLLFALKHGFVGHSGMATGFFYFLIAVAAAVCFVAESRRNARVAAVLVVISAGWGFVKGTVYTAWPPITPRATLGFFVARNPRKDLRLAAGWSGTIARIRQKGEQSLADRRLPEPWLRTIASTPGGVDVWPWELTYLAGNGLPWRPSLVMQQYSNYTAALDEASARHLAAGQGPGSLLVEFLGFSQRHPVFDSPATWRAAFATYEPVSLESWRGLLLARRRSTPAVGYGHTTTFASASGRLDEWIEVPERRERLYARLLFHQTLAGRARQFAWKTPPLLMDLEYVSGQTAQFRILAGTASAGLLLNYAPRDLRDLWDLWQGVAFDRVRRFRILGAGASAYERTFSVEWETDAGPPVTEFSVTPSPAPGPSVQVAPAAPSGVLDIVAEDPGGYRNIQSVRILLNREPRAQGACAIRYDIAGDLLWLLDDTGTAALAYGQVGLPDILESDRCAVSVSGSRTRYEGTRVHLSLDVAPRGAAAPRTVFVSAVNRQGRASPWRAQGAWAPAGGVPFAFPPLPPIVQIEQRPAAVPGAVHIKARVLDPNGSEDVIWLELLVNNERDDRHACYLRYDRIHSALALIDTPDDDPDDDVDEATFTGTARPGDAVTLRSPYCSVEAATATVHTDARSLFLEFDLRLTGRLRHNTTVWVAAADRGNRRQNWRAVTILPEP